MTLVRKDSHLVLHAVVFRMVYAAIAEEMKTIHAFQMKTLTPDEWEKQKAA